MWKNKDCCTAYSPLLTAKSQLQYKTIFHTKTLLTDDNHWTVSTCRPTHCSSCVDEFLFQEQCCCSDDLICPRILQDGYIIRVGTTLHGRETLCQQIFRHHFSLIICQIHTILVMQHYYLLISFSYPTQGYLISNTILCQEETHDNPGEQHIHPQVTVKRCSQYIKRAGLKMSTGTTCQRSLACHCGAVAQSGSLLGQRYDAGVSHQYCQSEFKSSLSWLPIPPYMWGFSSNLWMVVRFR